MHRRLIATSATLVLALGASGGASADQSSGTRIDTMDAWAGEAFVRVQGDAIFVDAPVVTAEDPRGDALLTQTGTDVSTATVRHPPSTNTLQFAYTIEDMPSGGPAPGVAYTWPITLNDDNTGLFLMASRPGGLPTPCPGTSTCHSVMRSGSIGPSLVQRVTGSFSGGKVTWNVPLGAIGAAPGDSLSLGGPAPSGTTIGVNEGPHCCATIDGVAHEEISVSGPRVRLGIAPAGTPPSMVPLDDQADLFPLLGIPGNSTVGYGSFTGYIFTPDEPGAYVVVAEACYAASTGCGLETATIIVE